MFTEITEDTISATDSCQMETTGTTLKVSPATQPTNQVTSETYTVIPPRRTFNEQKPFVFSIIGFAVFYHSSYCRACHQNAIASSFLMKSNKKQATEMNHSFRWPIPFKHL